MRLPLILAWPVAASIRRSDGRFARWFDPNRGLRDAWSQRHAAPPGGRVVTIAPHRLASLTPDGAGAAVTVIEGSAWITQSGDRRDHLPSVGERVLLADRGHVVVQNLGDEPLIIACEHLD